MNAMIKNLLIPLLLVTLVFGAAITVAKPAENAPQTQIQQQATNAYPGELGGIVAQIEANKTKFIVFQGEDVLKIVNDTMVEATGQAGAAAPAEAAFILTLDAAGLPGAGESEHRTDPWPMAAFDKDGHKLGSGMFPRGAVEAVQKAIEKSQS